jgi:hypothetical protein
MGRICRIFFVVVVTDAPVSAEWQKIDISKK